MTPARAAENAEDTERLLAAVDALPEIYRETVVLFHFEERTYDEIAQRLAISTATVNARLTKARARLRERLKETYDG